MASGSNRSGRRNSDIGQLANDLHSTAIHLLRLVRVQDAATGIAPARLSALSVIVFGGPISLNDLARAEQVRPPTMSRIVDALESAGLAKRTVNLDDRRAITIEATKKGTEMLQEGRRRRVEILAQTLRGLNTNELRDLKAGLTALHNALRKRR